MKLKELKCIDEIKKKVLDHCQKIKMMQNVLHKPK